MFFNGRKRLSWPKTALNLALNVAYYRSEDPYVQVGAVAIKNDDSVVLGYNGAPSGVEIDWSNRDDRRKRVIHAEANVLNFVKPNEVKFLATTHLPCPECLKIISQKKINLVYYRGELEGYPNDFSFQLAEEFKIKLIKLHV